MPRGSRRGWSAGGLAVALLTASCGSGTETLDEEAAAAALEAAQPLEVSLNAAWSASAIQLRGNDGRG